MACLTYRSLHAGTDTTSIPLYLGAPWYAQAAGRPYRDRLNDRADYTALSRYSVASGYALAPTAVQTTVHALLETVERDACSMLIIGALLAGRPPAVLAPATLPDELAALRTRAEREAARRVYLIDATSDLAIPTVLAYVPPTSSSTYLRGQAAALTFHEAVQGALCELLESTAAPP
ncbi:YcaO-like family protein [Streptomyces sp. NPDC050485]|uniref:YcaO-like family protein n=1 Tax=Streptomyces sp. NPDC050485 TaxID=3365617 RepID=UPI003789A4D5